MSQDKEDVVVQLLSGEDHKNFKTIEVSYRNIPFEHENYCHLIELRDVSHLHKLQEQKQKLEVIDTVTATVAHNMITPLKSISLLSRNMAQNLGLKSNKDVILVFSTSQLLLSDVMLLLDRNKLDKDIFKPNFTSLSVNKTIESTIALLQLQAKMQHVKIVLERLAEDFVLELDQFRMQQVVVNLLSNALKFSKPFDRVIVKLQVLASFRSDQVELQIDVTDSGCGISEQEQLLIFTPYFKSSNQTSLANNGYGVGIGLSICQRIMSHLGGSIAVKSKIDVGSTFTVKITA